ncbi:MAG: dNTP triphosphohydrolase [Bacteroidota bacterium]
MNWESLLQPQRLGCPKFKKDNARNEFQRDFDRIIFSPQFRRLHGKTQAFPFPETDILHTRLTHSLETASVGRSLGTLLGKDLSNRKIKTSDLEVGTLVSVACLAHDLGNPPLGHSGEDAIREYFNSQQGEFILEGLKEEEKRDFKEFESNALGFHFLTHSNTSVTSVTGGLGLTLPMISTYCKYPRASLIKDQNRNAVSEKKPGLLSCDLPVYMNQISNILEIKQKKENAWFRHPLAFLNEAADDICNAIIDFEDGYKHGIISYETVVNLFKQIASDYDKSSFKNLDRIINKHDKVGYLRSKAINSLIFQSYEVFIKNEGKILSCDFDVTLFSKIKSINTIEKILELSKERIYSYPPILQIEAAGFKVLPGLLDTLLTALAEKSNTSKLNPECKKSASKVLKLIPNLYVLDYKKNQYDSILSIVGYIAGMTDNFAIDLYRNLSGIQIPNYK